MYVYVTSLSLTVLFVITSMLGKQTLKIQLHLDHNLKSSSRCKKVRSQIQVSVCLNTQPHFFKFCGDDIAQICGTD